MVERRTWCFKKIAKNSIKIFHSAKITLVDRNKVISHHTKIEHWLIILLLHGTCSALHATVHQSPYICFRFSIISY